jgi:hypothetical protein
MRCPTCKRQSAPQPHYGYCGPCYERAVKVYGELQVIITSYTSWRPEKYEYKTPDTAYVHFHRVELKNHVYTAHTNERQWCIELTYTAGFPCPPTVKFVSPYDYSDDNPVFWPRLSVMTDSLRQVLDLPYLSQRSSASAQVTESAETAMKFWYPHKIVDAIADKILTDIY